MHMKWLCCKSYSNAVFSHLANYCHHCLLISFTAWEVVRELLQELNIDQKLAASTPVFTYEKVCVC